MSGSSMTATLSPLPASRPGIDVALHLVVRLAGADRARETRRGIQYGPAPPVWPRAIKRDTHADRQRDFSDVPTALGVPYAYWGLTASTTTSTARPSRPRESSQDIPVNHSAAFAPVLQTHARHRNRHHRSGTGIGHSDQPHTARRHVTVVDGQIQRASVTTMKDVAG
jgi:hypothetical protein